MFSRRILGGAPDAYRLDLGYRVPPSSPEPLDSTDSPAFPAQPAASLDLETSVLDETTTSVQWTDDDPLPIVLQRIKQAAVHPSLVDEVVDVTLHALLGEPGTPPSPYAIPHASDPGAEVQVELTVRRTKPRLKSISLSRAKDTGGTVAPADMAAVLGACDLEGLLRLRCAEGMASVLQEDLVDRMGRLRQLNMSGCGLTALPGAVGSLSSLRALLLSHNRLTTLPMQLGTLKHLQILAVDNNLLTTIPVALKNCSGLHEISLENNKLTTPIIDLSGLAELRALHLFGNPLQFLPELTPCSQLRHLSLANVRITADVSYSQWQVEVVGQMGRGHRLSALFALIFRRSSAQHPVLAGALGRIAEDAANCELIWKEEGAMQQLVLMTMSDSSVVVQQACKTLGLLAKHSAGIADEIVDCDVLSAALTLITSTRYTHQIAGLQLIADLAFASESAAVRLMTPDLLVAMQGVMGGGSDDVKAVALEAIGNMAFCDDNRTTLHAANGIKQRTARLALAAPGTVKHTVKAAAIRALAILGENETVRSAVGRAPIGGRGLRILCMDGGGMRGVATVRMLRELEARAGKPIRDLFDLICGTSTGGILAASLAIKHLSLDDCDDIYKRLGRQVFSQPAPNTTQDKESWRDSLYRVYKSGQQHVRVAVYGAKHDTTVFESLLKQICAQPVDGRVVGERMIDTSVLGGPACFVVATLASVTPAVPYVFRNYEFPPGSVELRRAIKCCEGSSKALVWHAVRASSAAPYYLDDFTLGSDRFQDGAAIANNPALIALQEARALWPDVPIDCLVSMGCGSTPVQKRERSVSAYLETGNVLIESACSVDRADAALCTLLPLIPGIRYFRFNPVDPRCGMELDDIDPANLASLEDATAEYIAAQGETFDAAATALGGGKEGDGFARRLGTRRGVLLVRCDRSALADTHAERVGNLVAGLAHAVVDLGATMAPGDDCVEEEAQAVARGKFCSILRDTLSAHYSALGVVHLALHVDRRGPVVAWQRQLQCVAEPSAEAARLLRQIQSSQQHLRLADALAAAPSVDVGHGEVGLVSSTSTMVGGRRVTSLLLEGTAAWAHLSPHAVGDVEGSWRRLLIVTSGVLHEALIQAFLEHGAKGVVCAREGKAAVDADAAERFFRAMYASLLRGSDVDDALAAGCAVEPALQDAYCWYSSEEGRFLMHTLSHAAHGGRYDALVSRKWSWRDARTGGDPGMLIM